MKVKIVYFNILKSILICNVFCCLIAAIWMWGGRSDFFGRYLLALIYSYVMFGVAGSIFWLTFYSLISKFVDNKGIAHIVACGISSILAAPAFYLMLGEVNAAQESFDYLKFTIPTAAVCSAFYVYRYLQHEKFNKAQKNDLR